MNLHLMKGSRTNEPGGSLLSELMQIDKYNVKRKYTK